MKMPISLTINETNIAKFPPLIFTLFLLPNSPSNMQWTLTWLVSGRVSCFFTADDYKMASLPHVSMRKSSIRHRNLLHESEKYRKTGQLNNPMVKDKDGIQVGNKFDDSKWSLSMDEDYIVFCFGEDGSFDVVKDEELQEETDEQMHGNRSNDEREQIREGIDEFGMLYSELSDSNRSQGSNGSFAFPVLNWEWVGSPVKMPKSEGICQKKQKIRFVPFQCCRF